MLMYCKNKEKHRRYSQKQRHKQALIRREITATEIMQIHGFPLVTHQMTVGVSYNYRCT